MSYIFRFIFFLFLFCKGYSTSGQCDTLQGEVRWRFWQDVPLYVWEITDFYRLDRYPNGPDNTKTLYSLSTPNNYSDRFGSQIRGYLKSPQTGQVVFNVNGDDEVLFYLSSDNSPTNLTLINGDTSEVASLDTLTLEAEQYYYFELIHFELGGEDYATVEWKADFLTGGIGTSQWTLVGGDFIYRSCTEPCPSRGTSCDDGDPNTINDQYDGNCNCTGDPVTANVCVGERGKVQTYLYYNLPGGDLSTLNTAIDNSVQPDTLEQLDRFFLDTYFFDNGGIPNYGTYFQGFLSVPVTGYYSFNVTGSHQNVFYISSDDNPANKTAHELRTYWWTGIYDHDVDFGNNPLDQTAENILLQAGQYYYVEFRHKGANNDWQNFNLYWKTPYQTRDEWLRLPTFYFFDYTCETICVKNGVGCNDNDPYTANDRWNGSCNCSGTPCEVPDCDDPSTSYIRPEECETTNLLDNRADDAWLSCPPLRPAPNPLRTGNHWIQYDFGASFSLGATQIWNYNATGATAAGFQRVAIDYSEDGVSWEELGTYTWIQADGSANYAGFAGPDFNNITARYVLISSLDDPNSCRGLSKVVFNALSCPIITFTSPDPNQTYYSTSGITAQVNISDGDAPISSVAFYLNGQLLGTDNSAPYTLTSFTAFQNLASGSYKIRAEATDANGTQCTASQTIQVISLENVPCDPGPISIQQNEFPVYRTQRSITSISTINNAERIEYIAAESVILRDGFTARAGSTFIARIENCSPQNLKEEVQAKTITSSGYIPGTRIPKKAGVKLFPNPVLSKFNLAIKMHQPDKVRINIYDILGKEIKQLSVSERMEKGRHQLELNAQSLTAGLYNCRVQIGEEVFTRSFIRVSNN